MTERTNRTPDITQPDVPNYTRRRLAAAGLALSLLTASGLGANYIATHSESDYDQMDCEVGDRSAVVGAGETTWEVAARPLADELGISVDSAMLLLEKANPDIESLGSIKAGTSVDIPDCKS